MGKTMEETFAQDMAGKCSGISPSDTQNKEGITEIRPVEEDFSSPTPVKRKERPRIQSKDELAQLPEKYATLLEVFGRLMSSLRLLNLRKKSPTFQNVRRQIEILAGRKFLPSHLAQIKYILPEAVQIDKILVHDEKTKCMKVEMNIRLLSDVVKHHDEDESVYVALSTIFSSRLRDFNAKHPEQVCDIPEAELPDPFNEKRTPIKEYLTSQNLPTLCETEMLNSSHLPPFFQPLFNQKTAIADMETTDIPSPVKSASEVNEVFESVRSSSASYTSANMTETTPMKPLVGNDGLTAVTPAQSTPLRPISSLICDDQNKMTSSHKQSTASAKKALNFASFDGEETVFSHKQKQKSVCPSDLVPLIHQIFQSVKFNPITKAELVHKIIMNSLEFDDHSEIETQMENLEKLAPDWFFKKMAPSGDLMYNVRKVSDLKSVCEKINAM
ncbi:CDT1-like protein a, chloroplastic isoform X1 [Salvia hispanica]|uniref:CDT1-like protein a, chloroplastic isoform X1 n=1 Tax=Salvia hispanica TaxID=49212 RepID=UPI002009A047|nr:CDT1-like protein a, chloroplastic isoform X1 [Salvia hispanica]XP_047954196.1 CDT1-like protein a, chloroplastic isoform X1 [Salvia hispanica]